ncbi:hypothetical protein, partial [Fischerella thermalis]|uniref:hypothetical protein n=1 Tax=Fischerella thermalis TaxID=372787 RepID=UPI001CA5F078
LLVCACLNFVPAAAMSEYVVERSIPTKSMFLTTQVAQPNARASVEPVGANDEDCPRTAFLRRAPFNPHTLAE